MNGRNKMVWILAKSRRFPVQSRQAAPTKFRGAIRPERGITHGSSWSLRRRRQQPYRAVMLQRRKQLAGYLPAVTFDLPGSGDGPIISVYVAKEGI